MSMNFLVFTLSLLKIFAKGLSGLKNDPIVFLVRNSLPASRINSMNQELQAGAFTCLRKCAQFVNNLIRRRSILFNELEFNQ
ncbi:hypothetical protein H681_19645 [Pseudomonas sp. ATCC 13867]|nr:hypothetical protein H681_19645 [Pseudomonas sp. ATCC 13867]RFQ16778.1 hypothetical protein D0N87_26475 [Pseudomonas sp. ATCC 13867]